MALFETNWNPTSRQLRQFSGLCFVALPLLAWLWSGGPAVIAMFAGIGLLIGIVAAVYPKGILPLYFGCMFITAPIGQVVGEWLMFVIYISVFLPIGMIFRVILRDRLRLKVDRQASSYWRRKHPPKSVASYYRQF